MLLNYVNDFTILFIIYYDLFTKSALPLSPWIQNSGKNILITRKVQNPGPKNWWICISLQLQDSGNPLKSRFESEIWAKIVSKSADPFAYSPPLEDWITNCRQSGMFTEAEKKIHTLLFVLRHQRTRFSRTAVIKRELSAIETTHSLAAKLLTQSAKWLRKLATFFKVY